MKSFCTRVLIPLALALGAWTPRAAAGEFEQVRTFVAGGTVASGALVKLSAGQVVTSGTNDQAIGLARAAATAGKLVAVRILRPTAAMIASGAISAGAEVYPAANGKVSATQGGVRLGVALAAADDAATVEVALLEARALAPASVFLSSEQTGSGAEQTVAHGLGVVPNVALVIPSNLTGGAFVVAYGTHTATNCAVTVTNGEKYRVLALK